MTPTPTILLILKHYYQNQGYHTINIQSEQTLRIYHPRNNPPYTTIKYQPNHTLTITNHHKTKYPYKNHPLDQHQIELANPTSLQDLQNIIQTHIPLP